MVKQQEADELFSQWKAVGPTRIDIGTDTIYVFINDLELDVSSVVTKFVEV